MAVWSSGREAVEEALIELGFSAVHQFGVFVTYERERDSVKVHAAPDGMFAAFDGDDEILGEGTGARDLHSILMKATLIAAQHTDHRRSFLDRRTRTKGSRKRAQARSVARNDEEAHMPFPADAFSE